MVDIGRDAHWGRNQEGYGEDTLLTCRMTKAAVDAGCHLVMSSFNTIGGVPVTIDPKYMRNLLREEWGFDGDERRRL